MHSLQFPFFKDKKEKALCFIHLWPLRSILHEKGSLHCLQFSPKWETDPTRIRCVLSKQLQEVNIHCTPCNSRFFKDKKEKTPCFILLWPLRSILHKKRLLALFANLIKMGNRSNLYEMCPINTTAGRIYSLHSLQFSFFQRQERKSAMFHSFVAPQINPA